MDRFTVGDCAKGERVSSQRVLLIGTALSVRQLEHALAVMEPAPQVVGCLLPAAAVARAKVAAPVLGEFAELSEKIELIGPDLVLISLPLAMQSVVQEAAGVLDRAGVAWRFMPTFSDQLAGRTGGRLMGWPSRAGSGGTAFVGYGGIDPAAMIDRKPAALDDSAIRDCLTGKVVMITGSGGSIGSELARGVCRYKPARLILVERAENAIFEIDREIQRIYPDQPRTAALHDVTHRLGTFDLLEQHKPDVIFHAAAHKHVPMMEDHPAHAVENNFYGTRAIADAADAHGVERFVMISSDKAVNPSSVMGATKRLAELYIQHLNMRSGTTFSMVRFGNVLGSACSVLTIWTEQLARGGPITVTHPDMTRYFMTIPEAAALVLQAGALSGGGLSLGEQASRAARCGAGGEVFLLDMGQPIRIVDLARRFVRSQGLEPDVDIAIEFTGIRPGEKLFEELAYDGEDMLPTPHASIRIWKTTPPDTARMRQIVQTFDRLRLREGSEGQPWRDVKREAIISALRMAIPEMVAAAAG